MSPFFICSIAFSFTTLMQPAQIPSAEVIRLENERIALVKKISPPTVAVVSGGGSGVLISSDGYALTNFHVVGNGGPAIKCGLPDGKLYDGVIVGLDKMGDLALIKLIPPKPDFTFPFAVLGDSDQVLTGDWAVASGNPFLLASDYTPTVTFGLISGTHRYQYPERGMFEYTDCIQMDASINPGNSGGPLFNMKGELIGINGRGSFDKRGRVNSGVGYAISINQCKKFLGSLKAGLRIHHAGLGALVGTVDDSVVSRVLVNQVFPSDALRRGIQPEDQIISFAGRPITTVNQFKNILGTIPAGWKVPVGIRRVTEAGETKKLDLLVRLISGERQEAPAKAEQPPEQPPKRPGQPKPAAKPIPEVVKAVYEAKENFANYYFNKNLRDKALVKLQSHLKLLGQNGAWQLKGQGTFQNKNLPSGWSLTVNPAQSAVGDNPATMDSVGLSIDGIDFQLEPLKADLEPKALRDPVGSGGLLIAAFHLRQFLSFGAKGFPGEGCTHGGVEPYWPPLEEGQPFMLRKSMMAEVIKTTLGGVSCRWYIEPDTGYLWSVEVSVDPEEDPCEIHFTNPQADGKGRLLPRDWVVIQGDKTFARLKVADWKVNP